MSASVASRSWRVSLIVIPFCLSVGRSFRDLQPTTIDRSQPNLVGRYIPVLGPVYVFLDPLSPILSVPEGKICKISPIAYSCHCERDASCHMTLSVCLSVCLSITSISQEPLARELQRFLCMSTVIATRPPMAAWQTCDAFMCLLQICRRRHLFT